MIALCARKLEDGDGLQRSPADLDGWSAEVWCSIVADNDMLDGLAEGEREGMPKARDCGLLAEVELDEGSEDG